MTAQPLLEIRNLKRNFGGVWAVDGVNMSVQPGEVRAVIGPNGAGKSTLFKMIAGRLAPTEGTVMLGGRNVAGMKPHEVFFLGCGYTFQVAHIFTEMTVVENVVMAVLARLKQTGNFWRPIRRMAAVWEESKELVHQVGLLSVANMESSFLALGDRKRLEVGIALAGHPQLLLLDEPTAGMSLPERQSTIELLEKIARSLNKTVLFTEHDMDVVFRFADRISVLQQGRVIAEGEPAEIRANPVVRAAYLGKSAGKETQHA